MTLLDLLKSLEHAGDITPVMESDEQGQFCAGLTANQSARTAIAVWYIKNTERGDEILIEPLAEFSRHTGRPVYADIIADYMESSANGRFEMIGHVVAALAEKQAIDTVEQSPEWDRLMQFVTERERA